MQLSKKVALRLRIKKRIRKKVRGTAERPRLSVFRSNRYIYAQLIDDDQGKTLVSASSREPEIQQGAARPIERSALVGKRLAERARALGIEKIVFDRNGYQYHGNVQALAEGAREGGLIF